MRYSICTKCGGTIREDDTNPNIHYSEPETICWRCKIFESAPLGDWFQREDGSYYQKR